MVEDWNRRHRNQKTFVYINFVYLNASPLQYRINGVLGINRMGERVGGWKIF